ncbi:hypothetical protein [Azospirillum himalayense]
MKAGLIAAAAACFLAVACGDGTHAATERDVFNAYFYFPGSDGKQVYLGKVAGISACQSAARSYAFQANMSRSAEWSYICCREANGSSCYDKHR